MNDELRDALLKLNFTEKLQLVRDYNNALKENYPIECSLKQLVERYRIPADNSELLELMKNIALNSAWIAMTEVDEHMKGNM
jgi:hypothetical protein